jgi:hypothetical protein
MNDTTDQTTPALDAAATADAPAETTPAPKAPRVRKAKGKARKAAKRKPGAPLLKRVGDRDHRVDLSHYKKTMSAAGNPSLHNGDAVAVKLAGLELDDVYKEAARVLKESQKALRERYKNLNAGMQRMNLGNRIRGALVPAAAKAE